MLSFAGNIWILFPWTGGLNTGSVISWFLSSFYLLYKNLKHFSPLKKPKNVRNYLRRYKDMPLYSMPTFSIGYQST